MVTQNMFVFRFVAIHASTQLSSYPDCEVTLIKSSLRRNILINKIYLINLNEKSTEQIGNISLKDYIKDQLGTAEYVDLFSFLSYPLGVWKQPFARNGAIFVSVPS